MVRQVGYLRANYRKVHSGATIALGLSNYNAMTRGFVMATASTTGMIFIAYSTSGTAAGSWLLFEINAAAASLSIADWT